MKVYKKKQYLVFDLDNNKQVKYDFSNNQTIGFSGKKVKNLQSQLKGITLSEVIESCEDKNYGKFLSYIKNKEHYISNIGTILSKVPYYKKYEQLFSAGLYHFDNNFHYRINDLPKSLIKNSKKYNIRLSNSFVKNYKENVDIFNLGYNLKYNSLDYEDVTEILNHSMWTNNGTFIVLVKEYNYSPKALYNYMDYLKTFEALENMNYIMRELMDYNTMLSAISKKYDKYPRNFLTTHSIACRTYNRFRREFKEEMFTNRVDKSLEYSYKNYRFIYPSYIQDIKDEAVMQNNCVASYIDSVINGNCHIMFMRDKDSLDKSLVTLEIRNNQIVQAKGKYNRDVFKEEQEAINSFNRAKRR